MSDRFHGVFTLILLGFAGVVAFIALLQESTILALVYMVISSLSLLTIVYFFCGKCVCRKDACAMVLPAKLSKRLPERKDAPYTYWDLSFILLSLVVMSMFPQYWLWRHKVLFILYWALFMAAHMEITFIVCKRCDNTRCPIHKKKLQRESAKNPGP